MKVYQYNNATVYITKPTEKHLQNIRGATEVFLRKVMKERIRNGSNSSRGKRKK